MTFGYSVAESGKLLLLKLGIAAFAARNPVFVLCKKYTRAALRAATPCSCQFAILHFIKTALSLCLGQ